MSSLNVIVLAGNTGRDPSVKTVGSTNVAKFPIAVNRRKKDGDEETTWFNVACWGKLADLVSKHVGKGSFIVVVGEMLLDKKKQDDGTYVYYPEVNATNVTFGALRPIGGGEQAKQSAPRRSQGSFDDDDMF